MNRADQDYLRATGDCPRCHGKGGKPVVDKIDGLRTGKCTCAGKRLCSVCNKWRKTTAMYTSDWIGDKQTYAECLACHRKGKGKLICDTCGERSDEVRVINISLKPDKPNNKKFCAKCYQEMDDSLVNTLTPKSKRGIVKTNKGYQYTLLDLDKYKTKAEH